MLLQAEKAFGATDPSVGGLINNLGGLYLKQGRYAEATPFFKRALEIAEKSHPPNHPDVEAALGNLAKTYELQDRFAEVETLYEGEVAKAEKGRDRTLVAIRASSLADIYRRHAMRFDDLGRYADADPIHKQALCLRRKTAWA